MLSSSIRKQRIPLRCHGLAIAVVCAIAWEATAGDAPAPAQIRVVGEATVSAAPDVAWLDLAVVSEAGTAEAAVSRTAKNLEAVLAALRKTLGDSGELATQGYSVTPRYRYDPPSSPPRLEGYTARGGVRVTLRDPSRAGRAIDAATAAGANEIGGLSFGLNDEAPRRAEALRAAALDARARVAALASALDLSVLRVLSLEEETGDGPQPRVYAESFVMQAKQAVATPIEAQDVVVRARVRLVVEVAESRSR